MGWKTHVLEAANRTLRPFGVCLRRRGHPTRTFEEFVQNLRQLGLEFRTVIDVGVARGTPGLYKVLPEAVYHLVEPSPDARPHVERLLREINGDYHAVAAGAEDGAVAFFNHDDISGSSLYAQVEGEALDGQRIEVPMRRLDSLLPCDMARPVLLKVDTQGHELAVIEGARELLPTIDAVILETSMMEFRTGIPIFHEVIAAMAARGFVVYDLLEGHERLLDGALAQVDVAFVPKMCSLRADKRFFSNEQLQEYLRSHRG